MQIYLVGCYHDYESSNIFTAFELEEEAKEFKEKCDKYLQTKPAFPEDENDYEEWDKKETEWRKVCPAGEDNADVENYFIRKCELRKTKIATQENAEAV